MKRLWLVALAVFGLWPALGRAQVVVVTNARIVAPTPPPRPPYIPPRPAPAVYRIKQVDVQTTVRDQVAQVHLSQVFQNVSGQQLEAQLIFPMPDDAAISELTLLVDGKEFSGKILRKEEARAIYESIVRQRRDPALLEYIGQGMFQTSVFPIPPGAERTVQIRYAQLLKKDSGLVDLNIPIGVTKHCNHAVDSLNISVRVEANDGIMTIYSPSHAIELQRPDERHAHCKLTLRNVYAENDFRLLYGTGSGPLGTHLISYKPHDHEEGYFVLLVSPDIRREEQSRTPRSMIFVLDRSGSMNGEKIRQAREALKFLVQQLRPEDTFNIVVYDSVVESFRPELQRADSSTIQAALGFAEGIFAGGSTNIDGALQTSLRMLTSREAPSYVLFLTDGLPTVGERNEQRIAANAKAANQVAARMFNFGVGFDVNARLLDRLSTDNRGQSVYVRPNEDIEASVSNLYTKIGNPLLTNLSVKFDFDLPPDAASAAHISRTYPKPLSDLFYGEQFVLVGRYRRGGHAKVTITGRQGAEERTYSFPVAFAERSTDETNGFAEKLWATRRVGEIIDELDLRGHNQELVDELVQLSIRHGIITPYTAFLADDGVRLSDRDSNSRRAREYAERGLANESGGYGVAQRALKQAYKAADNLQSATPAPATGPSGAGGALRPNAPAATSGLQVLTEAGESKTLNNMRQVGQKTFFLKDQEWQDSTVTPEQRAKAVRIRQYSKEYFDLAASHGGTLAKYLAFNEPVVLNLGDKTYQIDPPAPEDVNN